jgi:hypothetical protein
MPQQDSLSYREIRGPEIAPWLDDLGRLRITVFREYPYLYDGDLHYEREYLKVYTDSPRSLVVLLESGGELVGATTCLPMEDEDAEFQAPFVQVGIDVKSVCYFGESIILAPFRGRGSGHEFFRRRERHARDLGGFRYTAFCAVDRPDDHPAQPTDYRPLHDFWNRMGYLRRPELRCEYRWKEIGEEVESPKSLTFWLKEWA